MMKENWVCRRGDIYMANLNPFKGSEQGGPRLFLVLPLLREIRTSWEQMKIIRLWKMICGGRWIILNSPIRNMTSTVTLWMKSGTTLMSLRHI